MSDLYPIALLEDRYGGAYSGGKWLGIAGADQMDNGAYRIVRVIEDGPHGDDTEAMLFWDEPPDWIAVGATPDDAIAALKDKARAALSAARGDA